MMCGNDRYVSNSRDMDMEINHRKVMIRQYVIVAYHTLRYVGYIRRIKSISQANPK